MKNFILELGRDFLFIGEEYKIQVGNSDFKADLLFFHRGLQCLIVVELKAISTLEDIHFAIGRSYLKAASLEDGVLLNFATSPLTIKRFCRELPSQNDHDDEITL